VDCIADDVLFLAEIDEAFKIAQPEVDRMSSSPSHVASADSAAPAPGMFADPATTRPPPHAASSRARELGQLNHHQQIATVGKHQALQNERGGGSEWWRVALASAVVIGLGSGLGILLRRMLSKGSDGFSASDHRREREAAREQENSRTMNTILEKLESLQGSVSQTNRSIDQVWIRDDCFGILCT
jgi:hypothetical protein